jgi:hypothetical protein
MAIKSSQVTSRLLDLFFGGTAGGIVDIMCKGGGRSRATPETMTPPVRLIYWGADDAFRPTVPGFINAVKSSKAA